MSPASNDRHTEDAKAELRADIDHTRREIDLTVSEMEQRLSPSRLRHMAGDRFREMATPWREQPMEQAEALSNELITRLRETAWMNPTGLGMAAIVAGYLLGRRSGDR